MSLWNLMTHFDKLALERQEVQNIKTSEDNLALDKLPVDVQEEIRAIARRLSLDIPDGMVVNTFIARLQEQLAAVGEIESRRTAFACGKYDPASSLHRFFHSERIPEANVRVQGDIPNLTRIIFEHANLETPKNGRLG